MKVGHPVPILRIFDEDKAKSFYLDFLGFALVWEHRFEPDLPLYLEVVLDECRLHLSEHHGDACPGAALRISIDDVDAYCRQLNARHDRRCRPAVQEMPWGSRDMAIVDPFGNRLIFTQSNG